MVLLKSSSPHLFTQKKYFDFVLLGVVVVLSVLGLILIYDASQFEAFQSFSDKYFYLKQQGISLILGFLMLTFFSLFDYHHLVKIALPLFLFTFLLLLLVFLPGLGVSAYGAHRWLKIAIFTLQPAEIMKLSLVIFLSALFQAGSRFTPLFLIIGLIGLIVGVFQKDLGSTIVLGLAGFGLYFISGAPLIHFLGLLLASFGGIFLLVVTAPYRIKRILAFIDPFTDPQGFSYHIMQILIALGSGGLFGLGIGGSRQKFAYIPEVTTDSIFSIAAEEFGFLGSLILIILFGILIFRGFKIAQSASDPFGKFLSSGIIIWLGAQTIINLAAMVSLMPLTGVPLPFISFGGSALIANLIAVGILLNISKQAEIKI